MTQKGTSAITPGAGLLASPGAVSLVALVALCFLSAFPGGYILDDWSQVVFNPLLEKPDITGILTSDYWGVGFNSNHYRPLTVLSFAGDRLLWGLSPSCSRLANVLLHGTCVVMVFFLWRRLGIGLGIAWFSAALFAVHPVHAEVVNMVVGRAELLAAAFALAALLLVAAERPRTRWLAVPLYCAALLSKESAVALPLLMGVIDLWRQRNPAEVLRRRWVFYACLALVTLAWLALRSWAVPWEGVRGYTPLPTDNPLVDLGMLGRILTRLKVQVLYLMLLAVPLKLRASYGDTDIGPVEGLLEPWGLAVIALAAAAVFGLVAGWRRRSVVSLGFTLHLAALAVTASVFVLTPLLMAERFLYLPSVGSCLGLGAAGVSIWNALFRGSAGALRSVAGLVILVLMGGRLALRNLDFRSDTRLWEAEVRRFPHNPRAWFYLAGAYDMEGRSDLAMSANRRGIQADERFWGNNLALGERLNNAGRWEEAYSVYWSVLTGRNLMEASGVIGAARALAGMGRHKEAIALMDRIPQEMRPREFAEIRGRFAAGIERGARPAASPPRTGESTGRAAPSR